MMAKEHSDKQKTHQNPQNPNIEVKMNDNHNCGCKQHDLKPFIGTRQQAPLWMRYDDLTIGYRINFYSFKLILKSLFTIHNETTNIWTHLIGALILISTALVTCTDYLHVFQSLFHKGQPSIQNSYPIGSGMSFPQNLMKKCIDPKFLHNQPLFQHFQINDLIYELCEKKQNQYECFIEKSHEKKLRNWLEYHLSLTFNDFEEIKVKMEAQIVPKFMHSLQNQIGHKKHDFLDYVSGYFFKQKISNPTSIIQSQYWNQSLQKQKGKQKQIPKWPLVFYLVCTTICLLCSVTYHLFYPLSQKAHSLCVCTDFSGISVLFGGSAIPSIYYGMYCYFQVAELYIVSIVIETITVFFLSFTDKFQNRKCPNYRVAIYVLFACLLVTPLFHMSINELILNNYNDSYSVISSIEWYTLGMTFWGIGGFIYASHIPERYSKTGKYDIWGHSHHYWHIFSTLAIMTIYFGCVQNYFTRKDSLYSCSST